MLPDEAIVKSLSNDFTPVMWKYDGLGGKVIQWTKAHGNTSDDPAHRIWILDADGREISRAAGEGESASSLTDWLAKGLEAWKKAKTPGIAHLFEVPPDGVDPAAPGTRARLVWYAATDEEGASPERKAAAARTTTVAEKVLASKRLETWAKDVDLWRVDPVPMADGAPLPAEDFGKLPRLVVLGSIPADGRAAVRLELSGAALTLDGLVAALGKLPKPPSK